jgi:3D (Asp-Asp-Asp) domain-containing protein
VYWPGEGQLRACSNGARLRNGHCAVDPKRIPFGSHVVFPDTTCLAVDSGPDVVSRKAARVIGHSPAQKSAIVIDRFFESKQAALEWERTHPHFMTVRVMQPGSAPESNRLASAPIGKSERTTTQPAKKAAATRVNANGMQLADNAPDSAISPSKRRTL